VHADRDGIDRPVRHPHDQPTRTVAHDPQLGHLLVQPNHPEAALAPLPELGDVAGSGR
jgi:hypothetical protein